MNYFPLSCKMVLIKTFSYNEEKMAQPRFALASELVKGLFLGRAPDAMVPLLESILDQFLQAIATEAIGATKYERTDELNAYRYGSRE